MSSAPSVPPAAEKRGLGCCGIGCIVFVIVFLLGTGLVVGFTYYGFSMLESFLSENREELPASDLSPDERASLEEDLANFDKAFEAGEPMRLALTGPQLTHILNSMMEESGGEGRFYVEIKNERIHARMSVFLDLGWFRRKWFNGLIIFKPIIEDGQMMVLPEVIRVGDKELPQAWMDAIKGINWSKDADPEVQKMLQKIRSTRVEGDKLIIETGVK